MLISMGATLTTLEHERQSHLARSALFAEPPAGNSLSQPAHDARALPVIGDRHTSRIRQHTYITYGTGAIHRERQRQHAGDRQLTEPAAQLRTELSNLRLERAHRQRPADERARLHEPAVNDEASLARIPRAGDRAHSVWN